MSAALITACIWVLAAAATAMLPMRRQYAPGITLLILAPVLIAWLAWTHGSWVGAVALAAFLSMFRNPLIYFAKKAMGKPVEVPKDPEP
ncbi:MAG: DUF2484 family protein [Pseudomonadota bacterium]